MGPFFFTTTHTPPSASALVSPSALCMYESARAGLVESTTPLHHPAPDHSSSSQPAALMGETPQSSVLQLAEQLSEGFAALSAEYQALFDHQRQLESKLSWAKQQYLDLLKRFTPDTLSQDHLVFLQDLEHVVAEPRTQADWVDVLAQSEDVERKKHAVLIKQAEGAAISLRAPEEVDAGVKIWSGPSADKKNVRPLRIRTNSDMSHMEKDFTTSGTPSKLGCPFASGSGRGSPLATPRSSASRMSLRGGRRSQRPSFNDPIRAEICGNDPVCASPSVEGSAANSAAVCPIRFLDQHAPEEVAKYFEKHKHELPRSHEVCIARFQSNQESIEQLDRKYGNLVSMIQGLGEKHQAWLPEEPEEGDEEAIAPETEPAVDPKKETSVENWAKAVTASLHDVTPDEEEESPEQAADEARTAHFDRPLKEVRVGESPSRPWGIHIPAKYTDAESSSSVGSAPTASPPVPLKTDRPLGDTPYKTGKCPFDHKAMGMGMGMGTSKAPETKDADDAALPPQTDVPPLFEAPRPEPTAPRASEGEPPKGSSAPQMVPQMVFNGPVFLGYPPEQLMAMLQNSNFNLGGAMK